MGTNVFGDTLRVCRYAYEWLTGGRVRSAICAKYVANIERLRVSRLSVPLAVSLAVRSLITYTKGFENWSQMYGVNEWKLKCTVWDWISKHTYILSSSYRLYAIKQICFRTKEKELQRSQEMRKGSSFSPQFRRKQRNEMYDPTWPER